MPALLVALALTSTPLIGTFIGWYDGIADLPGLWTYCGGAFLLFSTVSVIIVGDRREKAAAAVAATEMQSLHSCTPKVTCDVESGAIDPAIEVELTNK